MDIVKMGQQTIIYRIQFIFVINSLRASYACSWIINRIDNIKIELFVVIFFVHFCVMHNSYWNQSSWSLKMLVPLDITQIAHIII